MLKASVIALVGMVSVLPVLAGDNLRKLYDPADAIVRIDPNPNSSFTALDDRGDPIKIVDGVLASPPICIKDDVTDLVWEVKTDDFSLRHKDWTYTWYNPDVTTNGGGSGSLGSTTCGSTLPNNQCNTQTYTTIINATGLCGANNWRLPTLEELQSILQTETQNPAINTTYFPNTQSYAYWTATTERLEQNLAWSINFAQGLSSSDLKTHAHLVRLVHDELNKYGISTISPNTPDLVVTAMTAGSSVEIGGKLRVSVTIENRGYPGGIAKNFQVGFYVSTNNVISQSDKYTGYFCSTSELRPDKGNNRYTCSLDISISSLLSLNTGKYYIGAYVDHRGSVLEKSESNNGLAASNMTTITRSSTSKPNLKEVKISSSAMNVKVGEKMSVSTSVVNRGTANANSFQVGIYLSNDNVITQNDTYLDECTITTLITNSVGNCSHGNITIPLDVKSGTYYLGAYADYKSLISEQNEFDNTASIKISVDSLLLGDFSGKWYWKQDPWWGYFYITQNGSSFSGTLDDVYEGTYGDAITNGKIDGNFISFTRNGKYGTQYFKGEFTDNQGIKEIKNGQWQKSSWTKWNGFYAKKQ